MEILEGGDQKKEQKTIKDAQGFLVIIGANLLEIAHVLNDGKEDRQGNKRNVEIKHLHGQQNPLTRGIEFHCLVEISPERAVLA